MFDAKMTFMNTEDLNPRSKDIDALSVEEIVSVMNDEDLMTVHAVREAGSSIAQAIKDAINCIRSGGGLIYIGAGTSGRLGVLDASEMPPTFNVPPDLIRAVIAGGDMAITNAVEGAEDDADAGRESVAEVAPKDMLLGITASGRTPFVLSALKEGKGRGAVSWLLTCNDVKYDFLDGIIRLNVGSEIVAGSTRLKAGTATKMALNIISTSVMIKLGKVYKGYMVDVVPSNNKLIERALRIIREISGCSSEEAAEYLRESRGNAKTAVLMYKRKLSYENAVSALENSGGSLREALKCCR